MTEPPSLWTRWRSLFSFDLPSGIGWAHVLGSLLLSTFLVQLLTGGLLALYYSPSDDAWDSVRYVDTQVRFGSIIRGVHHWAASAFIVLLALHLGRVFLWGAYKGPRRWTWVAGCFLLLAGLGFGFTGYLLPWDRKAYFGTRVGLEIAGKAPLAGPWLRALLQGGPSLGPLTLPRFYAIHAILLPLATLVLAAVHLILVRLHGITPPWRSLAQEGSAPSSGRKFHPHQTVKDFGAAFVLVAILLALAAAFGAPLEDRADPEDLGYVPRPEWYFLGLQQLLRLFSGPLEVLGTFVLPLLAAVLLVALPWYDRNPERRPGRRRRAIALGSLGLAAAAGLTLWGHLEVRAEERSIAPRRVEADLRGPPAAQAEAGDPARGEALHAALKCDGCHSAEGAGRGIDVPPSLAFEGSRARRDWLAGYLLDPEPIRFASDGVRPVLRMPEYRLAASEASALAAYLASRRDETLVPSSGIDWDSPAPPRAIEQGRRLFEEYQCLGCHRLGGEGREVGPALDRVGSRLRPDYAYAFIRDPRRIVPETPMKDSGLWEEEAQAIVRYLMTLR